MSATFESAWERLAPPLPLDRPRLAALFDANALGAPATATLLAEGLANTSYRVERDGRASVVVRLVTRDRDDLARELAARALAPTASGGEVPTVTPLAVALDAPWGDARAHVVVSPWVEGVTLGALLAAPASDGVVARAGREVGRALAALATVTFDEVGFLDATARLAAPQGPFSRAWRRWLGEWLAGRAGARLGHDLARDLLSWADRTAPSLEVLDGRAVLAHSDWKPKNLVVDPDTGALRAVLDWEFAWSGPPCYDLGLLLRHRDRAPRAFVPAVLEGLRAAGAWLPPDPLATASALDALNLVFLANREASGPGVLRDVAGRLGRLVGS